jgi:hypothetical protein
MARRSAEGDSGGDGEHPGEKAVRSLNCFKKTLQAEKLADATQTLLESPEGIEGPGGAVRPGSA